MAAVTLTSGSLGLAPVSSSDGHGTSSASTGSITSTSSASFPTSPSLISSPTSSPTSSPISSASSTTSPYLSSLSNTTSTLISSTSSPSTSSNTATSFFLSSTQTRNETGSTSTAASSSSTDSAKKISGSGGLSTGAKVGIAVGIVGGLAIIGILLAIFLKKRSRRRRQQYSNRSVPKTARQAPSNTESTAEKIASVAAIWQTHTPEHEVLLPLPQQADDATIRSRFSTLYDQIELHIENFYKDASPMILSATEGALSRYDTPLLSGPLAGNLEESPRATTLLKHILSYEITAMTTMSANGKRSLLPAELAAALLQDPQDPTRIQRLASTHRANPSASPQTHASAQNFTSVFSLWSNASYGEAQRMQHLSEVMNSAIEFAVWLFSQPERFEMVWEGHGEGRVRMDTSQIVTVPALVKVTHGGQPMARGQVICEPVFRRI